MISLENIKRLTVVYLLPLVESILAFLGSFLLFAPLGSLRINSCRTEALSDWYSIFYNPSIDYYNKIDCSQEVWHTLFDMIQWIFFLFLFQTTRSPIHSTQSLWCSIFYRCSSCCFYAHSPNASYLPTTESTSSFSTSPHLQLSTSIPFCSLFMSWAPA